MNVTINLSDKLVEDVRRHTNGENLAESISIALQEWIAIKKIKDLNDRISKSPLKFRKGFTSKHIRELNRKMS